MSRWSQSEIELVARSLARMIYLPKIESEQRARISVTQWLDLERRRKTLEDD